MSRKKFTHSAFASLLALSVLFCAGCTKPSAPAAPETTQSAPPPSDNQIASDVQSRIQADSGLAGASIQAQASNGIVTLAGTVADAAARELAANDAAQVNGVRTVVNNLTVQAAQAAAAPAEDAAMVARRRADEEARKRKQQEQARLLREKQKQQAKQEAAAKEAAAQQAAAQQAQNTPPPAPVKPSAPPPPPPPPQPVTQMVTVPAGTDLAVRTTESLETGKTQSNDTFHGVLASSLVLNGLTVLPRGASVSGVVLDAKDATHFKGQSELSLGLQQVQTRDQTLQISTSPVVRQGKARGKNTAVKAGGGALLGTLIGALAGGGRGALVGAAAGAGVGAGANAVTRGEQVQIPSESVLHFTLSEPVTVKVTTMPGSKWNAQGNSGSPYMQPPPN